MYTLTVAPTGSPPPNLSPLSSMALCSSLNIATGGVWTYQGLTQMGHRFTSTGVALATSDLVADAIATAGIFAAWPWAGSLLSVA